MSVALYNTITSTKYFLFGMQTVVFEPTKYFFVGIQTMIVGSTLLIFIGFTKDDGTELLVVSIRVQLTTMRLCYQHTYLGEQTPSSQRRIFSEKTLDHNGLSNNHTRVLEILRAALFHKNVSLRWMRWTKKKFPSIGKILTSEYHSLLRLSQ